MEPVIEENETQQRNHEKTESSLTIATCVEEDDDTSISNFESESTTNEVANPAQFIRSQTSGGTFGEVKIENSQDVHFGNKIFTAPITVVNAVGEEEQDKLGILEKKNCWERFKKIVKSTSIRERIAIAFLASLVLVIVLITTVISILLTNIQEATQPEATTVPSVTSAPYNCMVSRNIWMSRSPSGEVNSVPRNASLVVILHTATQFCKTPPECAQATRTAQNYHMDVLRFADIGYNFLVGGDGYIYEGRGWGKEGAYAKGYNKKSVGIGFIGKYHDTYPYYDTPTPDQVRCTQNLLEEGVKLGWLASNYSLVGYCDLLVGIPPGNVLLKEIRTWPHYRKEGNPGTCV
ncbi:peptidoglycan-recognition protein 1-like isoform X1 [Ctenocephalides felis]|uniref:peptidoglycan-recognition protein 1-like isoform X1 n=1 Tax=Ctenocephalides felis TaxID=7515 RepID=UPI000E6E5838|nr:peptidoglycan-recognition protein 1-like isoform X1 [Ctenocephalides felis]